MNSLQVALHVSGFLYVWYLNPNLSHTLTAEIAHSTITGSMSWKTSGSLIRMIVFGALRRM